MSSTHDRILTWLQTTPSQPDPLQSSRAPRHACKRSRSPTKPLSPPSSELDMPPETPKKRRLDGPDDQTPRPTYSRPETDAISLASGDGSLASGQSSPSKVFSALSLKPEGINLKALDLDDDEVPEAVMDLLGEMEKIARGKRVVPEKFENEILDLATTMRSLAAFEDNVFDNAPGEGQELDFDLHDIFRVVNDAKECQILEYDEAGWNSIVHTPLLHLAHYGHGFRGSQLDGFTPCTTARITPQYRIKDIAGKQVDYVLHLDPTHSHSPPAALDAIQSLRATIPDNSINHTSYAPLLNRPISISIETKRNGGGQRKAKLQMGVWQAAQWKLLGELAGEAISELEMIPGVVVEGHEWKFVATTNLGGKTTLWTDQTFGTTKTALGVFQIIAGMKRLRKWAVGVFWPWYLKRVLKLDGDPEESQSPSI